jgi:hypothetical protein
VLEYGTDWQRGSDSGEIWDEKGWADWGIDQKRGQTSAKGTIHVKEKNCLRLEGRKEAYVLVG